MSKKAKLLLMTVALLPVGCTTAPLVTPQNNTLSCSTIYTPEYSKTFLNKVGNELDSLPHDSPIRVMIRDYDVVLSGVNACKGIK